MEIRDFRNRHKGRRAFLLGNGPSLARMPFRKLDDEITFSVGRIGLMFDKKPWWRPTYYVCVTTAIFDPRYEDWRADLYRAIRESGMSFIWDFLLAYIPQDVKSNSNYVSIQCRHADGVGADDARDDFWQSDAAGGVSKFGTSLLAAAQLAAYMGLSPLYFLGLDGYGEGHFDEDYLAKQPSPDVPREAIAQRRAFEIIKAAGERNGFETYGVQRSNGYGVFDRVRLTDVL